MTGVTGVQLSVVIPAYNEADCIPPLVAEVHAALDGHIDYEVVCVDDCSNDATLERLIDLRRADPRVRVVHHGNRCGQSTALRTGIRSARAEWVATLDGDGQNDPADIPKLYEMARDAAATSGLQLVAGIRRRRRDSVLKRISSRIANAIRNALLHDGISDTGCGLKMVRRDAFLALPFFDHMHRFLPALIRRNGGTVATADVNHRPRRAGRSKYGIHNRLWTGLIDLFGVFWLQRRMKHPDIEESPA